jgi:hypothetical protein
MAYTAHPDGAVKGDTNVPWYANSIGTRLGKTARQLLENYSKIPADEVESHVFKIVSFSHVKSLPHNSK